MARSRSTGTFINLSNISVARRMKIKFSKDTMPDELYNSLLQHFVNEAVGLGLEVNKFTQFNNWVVECDCNSSPPVH